MIEVMMSNENRVYGRQGYARAHELVHHTAARIEQHVFAC
jgi:hypothetical protein